MGIVTKSCIECGAEFNANHPSAMMCSDECKVERRRRCAREYRKKNFDKRKEYLRQWRAGEIENPVGRKCLHCGESIDHRSIRAKYCSMKCKKNHDYAVNRDKIREQVRARRGNPEVRAKERERNRIWNEKNAESVREKRKAYYALNRERLLASHKEWRERNRQELLVRSREKYANDEEWREHLKASAREWRRENRELCIMYANERKRKIRRGDYLVTDKDWRGICRRYDNKCAYCAADGELTRDHIIPFALGGEHRIGNLIPACRSCNSSKNARLLADFRYRTINKERK